MTIYDKNEQLKQSLADERNKNYELRRQLQDAEDTISELRRKLEFFTMIKGRLKINDPNPA